VPSRVNLPPGCRSLRLGDGTRYVAAREGGSVTVADSHAAAIDAMDGNGTAGLVTGAFRVFGGGRKAGRWCRACQPARLWNPWNDFCPRCGAATEPESSPAEAEVPRS
jgi:hypothetical protein